MKDHRISKPPTKNRGFFVNVPTMKWLTLELIKQNSRIDGNDEDTLLELYGESAEETVLNVTDRSYEELIDTYGEVPKALIHASLMLVDLATQQRMPVSMQNLYVVPYTFDMLVKPYMKLTYNTDDNGRHCNL